MKCFMMLLGLALAALSLLAAGTPAHAGERPFSASGEGTSDIGQNLLYGSGHATHLGHCVLRTKVDLDDWSNGDFFRVQGQLNSASGKVLYFYLDPYYFDPAAGLLRATLTFASGSGRFEDATGSADVIINFDANLTFTFQIDGSINY